MAEAIAIVSFVSSVASLIEVGCKVVSRLQEFRSKTHDVPETFRHVESQLHVVIDGLRRIEERANFGLVESQTRKALIPTLEGCKERVARLLTILDEMLPKESDSSLKRAIKALRSLAKDKQVQLLLEGINGYLAILTFHNTSGLPTMPSSFIIAKHVNMAPTSRDPNYVARPDVFTAIVSIIGKHGRAALAGIGGIGKTQIAIEFCYKHLENHPSSQVLWMHAGSASNIRQSSQAIAEILKLPGWNDPQVDVVRALHTWLQDDRNNQWLLIIDNADDLSVLDEPFTSGNGPKSLFELLPRRKSGIILVTTRDRRVGERLAVRGHTIAVPAMSLLEGKQLLSTYLDSTVTYTLAEANQLLLALDFLPLAITQAAAYITENFVSLQDYLALLSKGDEDTETLLTESLSDIRRDDPDSNSVVKTWKLSFNQIRERDWRAADILSLMAMFDRQSLQVELFMREQESKIGLDKSLATLLNFSFISRTADGDAYRMHSLVRAAIQAWLRLQGTLPDWQQSALSVLAKIFPSGEYETWSRCEGYLPHAMIVLQYEPNSPHSCLERAMLLERIAMYDKEQYRFRPALDKSKEAAQIFQRFMGPEDPRTLSCSVTAANCLIHLFQLREAEQILEAATTTMRRVLGSQHRETARSMRYQGWVRYLSRKYRKAEDLLYTTMKHQEIELGPTDEETLNTMLFLATVLCKLGKQKQQQARVLCQKVLAAREAKFGPSHPNTIDTYCRLAICLNSLGEHSKAEALHRRALALRAKVFGIESEFAIAQMHNLAVCLFQQHKADKALAIYQACLALRIKVLGQDDARTFLSRANMIQTLVYLGYIKEAVGQSELIVASRDELMDSQHPSAIWTIRKAEQCLQKFCSPLISLEDTEIGSLLLSGSG